MKLRGAHAGWGPRAVFPQALTEGAPLGQAVEQVQWLLGHTR